jgi:hypothetical protein
MHFVHNCFCWTVVAVCQVSNAELPPGPPLATPQYDLADPQSCCCLFPVCSTAAQLAFVPDRHPLSPAWLHDFATTDKYAVLLEQPLYMSLASLLLGSGASHLFMNWQPQDEMRVHLVPLDGSGVSSSSRCL